MSLQTYYDLLGIGPNVSLDEIKKTYRKLSLQNHPDRNGNSDDSKKKFQNINHAYTKILEHHTRASPENPPPINDMINFFKQNNTHSTDDIATPIIETVYITLEQSYLGCMLPVVINRWIIEGNIKRSENETIYVDFFKGIDTNEVITYENKGNCLNKKYSDVKIIVNIKGNETFTREGLDIIYTKNISLKEALCGVSFQLSHMSGKKYIINNIENNTIITPTFSKVIRGLGFNRGHHTGNLIIKFDITFPEKLTTEQIKIIESTL